MEDHANLLASYGVLADDQAAAVAQHARAVGRVTGRSCVAEPGANCMRVGLDAAYTPSGGGFGPDNQQVGTLTYGRGVHDNATIGVSLSGTIGRLNGNAVEADLGPALAIWARVGEPGAAGINGGFGIGYGWGDVEVTRGRGLTDVIHATGDADLRTLSLRGDIGYGVPLGVACGDWVLTPRLGFAHDRAKRTGYTETGVSFNATYDAVTASRTQGSLALDADAAFAGHDLGFSLGIEVGTDPDIAIKGSTGGIPGRANLDVESDADYARLRPFAGLRWGHDLDDRSSLDLSAVLARAEYGDRLEAHVGVSYSLRF